MCCVISAIPAAGCACGERVASPATLTGNTSTSAGSSFSLSGPIDLGTQWAVFEPNDDRLWARVSQSVSAFLTRVWRDGALMGQKPEQAFFVKCDRTTMTQDDIDNGRLIMLVGIAPVKPAEFVIIRIGQWAGGSSVQEL